MHFTVFRVRAGLSGYAWTTVVWLYTYEDEYANVYHTGVIFHENSLTWEDAIETGYEVIEQYMYDPMAFS